MATGVVGEAVVVSVAEEAAAALETEAEDVEVEEVASAAIEAVVVAVEVQEVEDEEGEEADVVAWVVERKFSSSPIVMLVCSLLEERKMLWLPKTWPSGILSTEKSVLPLKKRVFFFLFFFS